MALSPTSSRSATGSGGLTKISAQLLGAPAASIDFPAIAATYTHLLLVAFLRSARAAASESLLLRVNGLSTAIYYGEAALIASGALTPTEELGQTSATVGRCPAASATALHFGAFELQLPNYADTTNHKPWQARSFGSTGTGAGTQQWHSAGGLAEVPGALTQLTLLCGTGANFSTGCQATLYGLS